MKSAMELMLIALSFFSKRQAVPSQRSLERSADLGPHGKVLYKLQVPNPRACLTFAARLERGQCGWRRGASGRTRMSACRRMARALLAAATLLAALSLSHAAEVPLRFGLIVRTGDAPGESTPFGQLLSADGSPVLLQDVEAVGFGPGRQSATRFWSASRGRAVLCGQHAPGSPALWESCS